MISEGLASFFKNTQIAEVQNKENKFFLTFSSLADLQSGQLVALMIRKLFQSSDDLLSLETSLKSSKGSTY
jgi:hypothetical protein